MNPVETKIDTAPPAETVESMTEKVAKLASALRESNALCLLAIKQRNAIQERYDTLEAQHRSFDDLRALINRTLRDSNLRSRANLAIDNETLRLELKRTSDERDNALAFIDAHKDQIKETGEGTVMV